MTQTRSEEVLVEFLSEFASHLIACGITMAEFRRAAQAAFVKSALSTARLRNSRVNQSAIAAATGLSRAQVRALLRNKDRLRIDVSTRIGAVISGWKSDPEFADKEGRPLRLPVTTGRQSFPALIRKYGRDMSHRAMLTEMRKTGLVSVRNGSVSLRRAAVNSKRADMTRMLSQGLAHVVKRTADESATVMDVITGEAAYDLPNDVSRVLMRRRLRQSTKAFAADLQVSGEVGTSRQAKKRATTRVSTRILVVTVG